MTRTPLIAGNWKMNLDHLQAIAVVQKLAWALKEAGYDPTRAETALFVPFTDLRSVQTLISADRLPFSYGAQDLSVHDLGAFTGEISGQFLKALDARYVLVGHSERRLQHHETDEIVHAKVIAALRNELVPVLCVGETQNDLEKYGASAVPVLQVRTALNNVAPDAELVIAYEPVWAIGSGTPATPQVAQSVAEAIRAEVAQLLGPSAADRIRILYGGSVKSTNIASYLQGADVDGALVGGASLDAEEFAKIVRFYAHLNLPHGSL